MPYSIIVDSHISKSVEEASGGVQRGRMTQRQGDKVEERQIFNEAVFCGK